MRVVNTYKQVDHIQFLVGTRICHFQQGGTLSLLYYKEFRFGWNIFLFQGGSCSEMDHFLSFHIKVGMNNISKIFSLFQVWIEILMLKMCANMKIFACAISSIHLINKNNIECRYHGFFAIYWSKVKVKLYQLVDNMYF